MRAVFATPAAEDWEAYLEADIDEEIYIKLPEEYHAFSNTVGMLRKAIYGPVQSGLCWYQKFTDSTKEEGFEQSHADPCLDYVDDVLLANIKDLDEAEFYIGCHITRDRKQMTLAFDHHVYAKTLAKRFNDSKTGTITTAAGVKALF